MPASSAEAFSEASLVVIRVLAQLQQQLACLHFLAGLEVDLLDDARRLEREIGAVDGAERADRGAASAAIPESPRSSPTRSAADWPWRRASP